MKMKFFLTALVLMLAAAVNVPAQNYVVDAPGVGYTVAHTDKYFVPDGWTDAVENAISKAPDDTIHLADGTKVKFVSLGFASKNKKIPAEIKYNGKTYYVFARDLMLSDDNPAGVKDPVGEKDFSPFSFKRTYKDENGEKVVTYVNTLDRHSEEGHELYGFRNIKLLIFLLIVAYAAMGLGFAFKKVGVLRWLMICLAALALIGIVMTEIKMICRLGFDFTWWMNPDFFPKKTCLWRSVILMAGVFGQLFSINLFQKLLDCGVGSEDKFNPLYVLIWILVAIIPALVASYFLAGWITGYDSTTADLATGNRAWMLLGLFTLAFISIGPLVLCIIHYKLAGIPAALFYTMFFVGSLALLFILIAAMAKLVFAIIIQFVVLIFLGRFISSDFMKDAMTSKSTPQVFYDNAGHMHYSAGDREAANREIAKQKAENS